jgi:hypothetical protein
MTDLHDVRKSAADKALAEQDFEADIVTGTGSWDADDPHDEWTCVLSMDGLGENYICGFVVRFEPGTANLCEAYNCDPH